MSAPPPPPPSSQRPVYIPKRRRGQTSVVPSEQQEQQQQQQRRRPTSAPVHPHRPQQGRPERFHGAFTGGFSAGYFNTVGTKDGWRPSSDTKRAQSVQDFMDEQDHEEWGGPTNVRPEYASGIQEGPKSTPQPSSAPASSSLQLGLEGVLEIKHETVGPRLLRLLGWRDGGTAFVPTDDTAEATTTSHEEDIAKVQHLSKRRLRQIQVQSTNIRLPPPKLDHCGLGFEPYRDAPEFQTYREQRKQRAMHRSSYHNVHNDNIYRISDVTNADGRVVHKNDGPSSDRPQSQHDYLGFETTEDFIGKRSVGGFALRDDEDDAYDNTLLPEKGVPMDDKSPTTITKSTGTNNRFGDEYNMEVYEPESSDDEVSGHGKTAVSSTNKNPTNKPAKVANLFASWATGGGDQSKTVDSSSPSHHRGQSTLTSDGRPPLPGFVLGGSMTNQKRYPGPDIPREYVVRRHTFGENEHPQVFQTISRALKLEQEEHTERQRQQQRRMQETKVHSETNKRFSALADAMKSRFTSGTTHDAATPKDARNENPVRPAGLYMPDPVQRKKGPREDPKDPDTELRPTQQQVSVSRTVKLFNPDPLVCKRFHVPVPKHVAKASTSVAADTRKTGEASFFETEILQRVKQHPRDSHEQEQGTTDKERTLDDDEGNAKPSGIERPSISELKSIFEAPSDESSSDGSSSSEEEDDPVDGTYGSPKESSANEDLPEESARTTNPLVLGNIPDPTSQELVEYRPSEQAYGNSSTSTSSVGSTSSRKKDEYRKRDRHGKRRKRKRSRDPSNSVSDDNDDDSDSGNDDDEQRNVKTASRRKRGDKRKKREKEKKRKKSSKGHSRHRKRKKESS